MAFDYESMVQEALMGVVKKALEETARYGFSEKHHFYLTFKTQHPHVRIPAYLKEEYPDEITIVLQHEFWDLKVEKEAFSVTLCFSDMHESIHIPFGALTNFVDPSVKFGLQFDVDEEKIKELEKAHLDMKKSEEKNNEASSNINDEDDDPHGGGGSKVIALDRFRKK